MELGQNRMGIQTNERLLQGINRVSTSIPSVSTSDRSSIHDFILGYLFVLSIDVRS